ncbi:Hypothetical protein CulFRC11_1759 [Corynebacterium ramonii]|uniref:DUF11 domain-containing protein n=2 Tax=Corynebacteriaceae TaxID=1653 RepID=A0ABM5RTU1_9CORY|nr:Hypothetical protein CulFRC11_1759 [Corynebacterium ramonii FRC0011]ESU58114.1 hypothetical protein D881_10185 [Corynebacterium ulcerans NCTC 12077]STC82662.1 Uncharacterised protein [Corynebacterium ulcerans]
MKFTVSSTTGTKRTAIALTCALATAASTLVAAPIASASDRVFPTECQGVEVQILSVKPSWEEDSSQTSSAARRAPSVGDTISYMLSIKNTGFTHEPNGEPRELGLSILTDTIIDGKEDKNRAGKFTWPNPKDAHILRVGEQAFYPHEHIVQESDLQEKQIVKRFEFPVSKGPSSQAVCSNLVTHTHTWSPASGFIQKHWPWLAGGLGAIAALVSGVLLFLKNHLFR